MDNTLLEKAQSNIIARKHELNVRFGIHTDRDLMTQLGITDKEAKSKIFAWIDYQCSYSYRDGVEQGAEELRQLLSNLITPKNK